MKRRIDWIFPAALVSSTVLAAQCQMLADAIWRVDYSDSLGVHLICVLALYTAIGALVGVAASLLVLLERPSTAWVSRRFTLGKWHRWLGPVFYGVVAACASYSTMRWAFSGEGISRTIWGSLGPFVASSAVFMSAALLAQRVIDVAEPGTKRRAYRIVVSGLVLLGVALTLVDRYVFVSLYERLHSYLECLVLVLWATAWALVLVRWHGRVARRVMTGLGLASVLLSAALMSSAALRDRIDDALTHAWVDPVYAGRMLRRVQELEAYLQDPSGYKGIQMSRLARLRTRYPIAETAVAPEWLAPPAQQRVSETRQRLAEDGPSTLNVLVFYVDTLRYDVAHDPSIMPNVSRFAAESLNFQRAYATGSDTLRSLPGITSGSYFLRHTHDTDLCELAEASEHESSLVIARSANEFLGRLRPSFAFEREVTIPDYDPGRKVWGYGADLDTSEAVVDAALDYLEQRGRDPFFMWLFHFDQHNWRELNDDYLAEVQQRHGVPPEGELNSRYRTIATAIDAQFGRLLEGLDRLNLTQNTAIVLVSDHGEGLGEGGFWVHSVFLWESLIHVPLVLKVPGVEPKRVTDVVSLVDVAPTLAGFLMPGTDLGAYHGEDLLLHADDEPFQRRFPILFAAALRDELVRVGMIDESGRFKLVVRLEAAQVELYDLHSPVPDERNIAREYPEKRDAMLRRVATSPLFPRELDDFKLLTPKGRLTFPAPSGELPVRTGH